MSGTRPEGEPPPDLPPEYAEAYRRGYERALREGGDTEPTTRFEALGAQAAEQQRGVERQSAGRQGGVDGPVSGRTESDFVLGVPNGRHVADQDDEDRSRRWLAPVALVVLALMLVLSAYGLGRLFSSGVGDADTATEAPDGVNLGDGAAAPEDVPSRKPDRRPTDRPDRQRYSGPVDAAAVGGASASCQSEDSVDAAGRPVSYGTENAYDGDLTTAWRCDGSGAGQQFTLTLAEELPVGEVGLVPGYAKTDPQSGVDRYAENNRITRVRWLFGDGSSYVQEMSGSATNRDLRTMRIPRTESGEVVVEILSSEPGSRNTIAISEVWVGRAVG